METGVTVGVQSEISRNTVWCPKTGNTGECAETYIKQEVSWKEQIRQDQVQTEEFVLRQTSGNHYLFFEQKADTIM